MPFKRLPVLVGCMSRRLDEPNTKLTTYEWVVYVKSIDDKDLAPIIRNVAFVLHHTLDNPKRSIAVPPYSVKETGFVEFDVKITIHFKDRTMKSFRIYQPVKLTGAPLLSTEEQLDEAKWLHDKHLIQINLPALRTILSQYSDVDDEVRKKIQANSKAQQRIRKEIENLQREAMESKNEQENLIKKKAKEDEGKEMKEQVEKDSSKKEEICIDELVDENTKEQVEKKIDEMKEQIEKKK